MHLVYPRPPNLHNHCFQFLLGITVAPRDIEENGYANFSFLLGGVNKVHYDLGENGEFYK